MITAGQRAALTAENERRRKLPATAHADIRARHAQGETVRQLAAAYHVAPSRIGVILRAP